uniref:Uncharacterized protein n=1 Tax=Panagrolaimus sp. ES5 TaxID=591445 RepID=A0AC34FTE6_9BILA
MRKSNGEIVESSEDEPTTTPSSSSPNSRPISRVSTTNSIHSLLNGDISTTATITSNLSALPPALQAFKFYFNAFSKSFSPWINLNILDKTELKLNVIYLSNAEILLKKLHPNEFYLVKFCGKLKLSSAEFSRKNFGFSNKIETLRVVQILSDSTNSGTDINQILSNFPQQLKGAKISRTTAFNIFGNNTSIKDCQIEVEILVCLNNCNPLVI